MPHLDVALQKPDWLTAMLAVWVNEGGAVVDLEAADDKGIRSIDRTAAKQQAPVAIGQTPVFSIDLAIRSLPSHHGRLYPFVGD